MQNKEHTILSIDTSCDETSVAVTKGFRILSNLLPSQMKYHKEFGGVVPSLAKIAHQERIDSVVERSILKSGVEIENIDAIGVTYGPGLSIALEIGIKKAKELAEKYNKPLVAVNHMEGHLLSCLCENDSKSIIYKSNFISKEKQVKFPVLGFLISGGHTELILMKDFGNYTKIGETLDDSCGEAFDKCGRILGLGYPGGPVISKFATHHRKNVEVKVIKQNRSMQIKFRNIISGAEYLLPIPMAYSGDLNFSFSGLKTAFNQLVSKLQQENTSKNLTKNQVLDLCVGFEAAAIEQLALKLKNAIKIHNPLEVWLGGGVIASAQLRRVLRKVCKEFSSTKIVMRYPFSKKLTGDNAAMIGICAYLDLKRNGISHQPENGIYLKDFQLIDRNPSLSF